jgi:poly-gamma-glutamate synthesis protein (capsule biosynthesis protein)
MNGKPIHYRMNPGNIFCLTAANIDICAVANNHVLDWGYEGLKDTLQNLRKVNINFSGGGDNLSEAESPVIRKIPGKGRVVLFSYCSITSGVPLSWRAEENKPGVNLITDLSAQTIQRIDDKIKEVKEKDDIVIFSIHWGSNWGYEIPDEQRRFAHELIDKAGVDIIHGHSSHHPRSLEVYKDKLILYGTGDLINDYEGIARSKGFRITLNKLKNFRKYFRIRRRKKFMGELVLMYFVTVEASSGKLQNLKLVPMKIKNFRLNFPHKEEAEWMMNRLNFINKKFNSGMEPGPVLYPGNNIKVFYSAANLYDK